MKNDIRKSYIWYRDKKIIGMIILFISIAFQTFAFLEIPFLTSIHGYTVGMMLGWYNPFFYVFIGYIGTNIIFEGKLKTPNWFRLNIVTYWIVAISIIFISVSTSFYQSETGYKSIGTTPWKSFNKWYDDFTYEKNAWLPINTNGGLIGAFMYSFFAMILSGIGALIASIFMIFIAISYIITGSSVGFYKNIRKSKIKNVKEVVLNKNRVNNNLKLVKKNTDKKENTQQIEIAKKEKNNEFLPLDDPFK